MLSKLDCSRRSDNDAVNEMQLESARRDVVQPQGETVKRLGSP